MNDFGVGLQSKIDNLVFRGETTFTCNEQEPNKRLTADDIVDTFNKLSKVTVLVSLWCVDRADYTLRIKQEFNPLGRQLLFPVPIYEIDTATLTDEKHIVVSPTDNMYQVARNNPTKTVYPCFCKTRGVYALMSDGSFRILA